MDLIFDELIDETEMAWIILFDGRRVPLPKSVCELFLGDRIVTVPERFAIENELEGYEA